MTIKWNRLQRIVEEILKQDDITITLSTSDELRDFISAVKFNAEKVDIILSSKCKTEFDVIRAVAHEVTHVLQGTSFHDDAFYNKWDEITDIIEKRYFTIS